MNMAVGCPYSGFGMGYGWLYQILIFVLFFGVVWWLLKNQPMQKSVSIEKPIDILKRRLAKGEITQKEFESLKKEIR